MLSWWWKNDEYCDSLLDSSSTVSQLVFVHLFPQVNLQNFIFFLRKWLVALMFPSFSHMGCPPLSKCVCVCVLLLVFRMEEVGWWLWWFDLCIIRRFCFVLLLVMRRLLQMYFGEIFSFLTSQILWNIDFVFTISLSCYSLISCGVFSLILFNIYNLINGFFSISRFVYSA